MKALRFVATIVLVCVAGVAQADVIAGNLLSNSDFNTDLTGWAQGSQAPNTGSATWTDTAPGGGGMLVSGGYEVYNLSTNTFTITSGTTYYASFVAGSPDHSMTAGLLIRMCDTTHWPSPMMVPAAGYTVSPSQLNAGWADYINYAFTPAAGNIGYLGQFLIDTQDQSDVACQVVFDKVVITTSPIAAGSLYVPEPGTVVLLVTGLIGLLAYAWRKQK